MSKAVSTNSSMSEKRKTYIKVQAIGLDPGMCIVVVAATATLLL
jgi:hypothetical protein